MTPDDHKRVRYQGRTQMAAIGADLARRIEFGGTLPEEGVETYVDGLGDGFRDMVLAFLPPATAYQILQRLADEASKHVPVR